MTLDLGRLTVEVRPTGTQLDAEALKQPFDEDKCHMVALGPDDIDAFADVAGKLAYGTAVVFEDLDEEGVAQVEAAAKKHDFVRWIESPYPGFSENAKSWIRSFYNGHTFSTHLPYLLEAVKRTTGPVLELGAGEAGSTPALHKLCIGGRLLVTVDSNVDYIDKFAHFVGDTHVFEHNPDPTQTEWLAKDDWSVVFIDHSPGETRKGAIERARGRAEYIIVHDTEDLGYDLEGLLSSFKFRKDFRYARPWTTVVSDTLEIFEAPEKLNGF